MNDNNIATSEDMREVRSDMREVRHEISGIKKEMTKNHSELLKEIHLENITNTAFRSKVIVIATICAIVFSGGVSATFKYLL